MRSITHAWIRCRRVGLTRIDELLSVEERCFETDRIVRRNLRRLLLSSSAVCIGAFCGKVLVGSMVLLFRSGSKKVRIYSLAVVQEARGQGIAGLLMVRAEREAHERACNRISLEVREDNASAIRLYERSGFVKNGLLSQYYEDGANALRMIKELG